MLSGSEKITGNVQWSLVNESKDSDGNIIIAAEVSSDGTLTGAAAGRATLTATVNGQTFTAIIRVS